MRHTEMLLLGGSPEAAADVLPEATAKTDAQRIADVLLRLPHANLVILEENLGSFGVAYPVATTVTVEMAAEMEAAAKANGFKFDPAREDDFHGDTFPVIIIPAY